jgi:hypothetical protein
MQVRGKNITTLTPALSRQREREAVYTIYMVRE